MKEFPQIKLRNQGEIPAWLSGALIRNGPVYAGDKEIFHWFDGIAMLHAFVFRSGTVYYSNKYLKTEAYDAVIKNHSLSYLSFAADPCRSIFRRFFTWFKPYHAPLHNANINLAKLAEDYVAFTEVPLPVRFDPKTLRTLGVLDYQDELPKDRCWESAHPHQENLETLNYLVRYGRQSSYNLYRIRENSSKRELFAKIPVEKPAYMHSFSKTENFVIFAEYPFTVDPFDLITLKKAFIKNFTWHQDQGTTFIVVDRHTGSLVGKFKTDSFFAFHHANAYEENGLIHVDIICYENAGIVMGIKDHFRPTPPHGDETPFKTTLKRFTINSQKSEVVSRELFSETCEFPRLNPLFDGQPYRYLYMADFQDDHAEGDLRPLFKFDHVEKSAKRWQEKGCYPGEPVFVAAPDASKEDDGVILSVIFDVNRSTSFLLVLDASTFNELGRAEVSHLIPPGLHGNFFPGL